MALLTAATDTLMYTCTTGMVSTKNVRFCETGGSATTIRLSKTNGGSSLAAADALLWEYALPANGVVEVTQLFCIAGDKIYARAASGNVACNVLGTPEEAA